eukprot:TRINITY_DN12170_c0_g1_i15.p1 TRINITY_DN12170_c0_g1~~TRINITY_DN12170_c0_g1_i15.p1  ORF type:complete len:636 (+),score=154.10 TRINITY_DN12170_c0_g1_i15:2476-4383(+)
MSHRSRKQLRNEASRLERENDKMEQRLRELRDTLRKQKQERLEKGGYAWKKGDKGAIRSHANQVLDENGQRREKARRIKVLPPAPGKPKTLPKANPRAARLRSQKSSRQENSQSESHTSSKRSSRSAATATTDPTQELEKAITAEHNAFLDALNDWRDGTDSRQPASRSTTRTSASSSSTPTVTSTAATSGEDYPPLPAEGGGKLLDGPAFDEQAAAMEFQQAVQQWREGDDRAAPTKTWAVPASPQAQGTSTSTTSEVSETETVKWKADCRTTGLIATPLSSLRPSRSLGMVDTDKSPLRPQIAGNIVFKDNLTYLERLLLKRQRDKASNTATPIKATQPSAATTPRPSIPAQPQLTDAPTVDQETLTDDDLLELELIQQRFQHWSGVQPDQNVNASLQSNPADVTIEYAADEDDESDENAAEPTYDEPSDDDEDSDYATTAPTALMSRPSTAAIQQLYSQSAPVKTDADGDEDALFVDVSHQRLSPVKQAPDVIRMSIEQAAEANQKHVAATTIQASLRGMRARRLADVMREEQAKADAALQLQAATRGMLARKQVTLLKEEKQREAAAIRIQASYRGHRGRETAQARKLQKIQDNIETEAKRSLQGSGVSSKRKTQPLPVPGQQQALDKFRQ